MSYKDYFVVDNIAKHAFDVIAIKDVLVDHFESLGAKFDNEIKIIRTCIGKNPVIYYKEENDWYFFDEIHLSISDCGYWCKVVYQLSHELMHLFTRMHTKRKDHYIPWIEELICEAMSLYYLKYFELNWYNVQLSNLNYNFYHEFNDYLNIILQDKGTSELSSLRGIKELEEYNSKCAINRIGHHEEVKELFKYIDEQSIIPLLEVKNYQINNKIIIDTNSYLNKYKGIKAVEYICKLQNKILKEKL